MTKKKITTAKKKPVKVKLNTILCRFDEKETIQLDELKKKYKTKVSTGAIISAMFEVTKQTAEILELQQRNNELVELLNKQTHGITLIQDGFKALSLLPADKKSKKEQERTKQLLKSNRYRDEDDNYDDDMDDNEDY